MGKDRAKKTDKDVAYVLSLIEKYDAVGYARKRAAELLKDALATLKGVAWEGTRTQRRSWRLSQGSQ